MSTFVKEVNHIEEGNTDDLMMCLVILCQSVSNQPFFKEMTDTNARQMLYEEQMFLIKTRYNHSCAC